MSRVALLLATLTVTNLPVACSSPCSELAEKICSCRATQTERTACTSAAEAELDKNGVSDADEEFCASKIDGCDCRALDTPEGKLACGRALPP